MLGKDFVQSLIRARNALDAAIDASVSYVQVVYPSSRQRYTFIDPSASLVVGDIALVSPLLSTGRPDWVRVVALGRGGYPGHIKELKYKMVPVALAE